MGLLSKIASGTKELHKFAEGMPFLKRYQIPDDLTLRDHYLHLYQLLPIYQLLEDKMKLADKSFNLSAEFSDLLDRAKSIQFDLNFIFQHLPQKIKQIVILPATQAYLSYLNQLNPDTDLNAILGHFLVRILGDLFGGQQLKDYVALLYKTNGIDASGGTEFYTFRDHMLKNFTQSWLNHPPEMIDEDEVVTFANESFDYHIAIFDALEKSRKHSFAFFSPACLIATAVTTAAIATTMTIGLS